MGILNTIGFFFFFLTKADYEFSRLTRGGRW